jgi:enterochelin esterase-like enzyme
MRRWSWSLLLWAIACSSPSDAPSPGGNGGGGDAGSVAGRGGTAGGAAGAGGNPVPVGGAGGASGGAGGAGSGGAAGAGAPDAGVAGAGGSGGAGGKPFCVAASFRISAKDGITDLPKLGEKIPPDSSNTDAPMGTSVTGTAGSTSYTLYLPAQYAQAKDGEVALMVYSPVFESPTVRRNLDRLIAGGEMPVTIAVFPDIDWKTASDATGANVKSRADFLAGPLFTKLKADYPKLSTAARLHGVGGQSTAGALAFDFAWARSDFFGKVAGSSASFADFQRWLYPYPNHVDASHKATLRVSLNVGELESDSGWVALNTATAQKLIDLGYATRLLVIPKGMHSPVNWLPATLDDMRWLWRSEVCP